MTSDFVSPQDNTASMAKACLQPLDLLTSCAVNALKNKPSSDLHQSSRKKAKRVHFGDLPVPTAVVPKSLVQVPTSEFNLCHEKNICEHLQKNYCLPGQSTTKRCIGYLETPQMYKHSFYLRDEVAAKSKSGGTQVSTINSVFDAMRYDADDALAIEDQLKLAHKTALALLQFTKHHGYRIAGG